MVYKPKTKRQEHSSKTITIIQALHYFGYSTAKIRKYNSLPKSTITSILRRLRKTQDPD